MAKVVQHDLLAGGMMVSGATIILDMRSIIDAVSYLHDQHGRVRPLIPRVYKKKDVFVSRQ